MLLGNCFYVTSVSAYVIRYDHVLIGNLACRLCESCFSSYHHHGNKCTSHSVQGHKHSARIQSGSPSMFIWCYQQIWPSWKYPMLRLATSVWSVTGAWPVSLVILLCRLRSLPVLPQELLRRWFELVGHNIITLWSHFKFVYASSYECVKCCNFVLISWCINECDLNVITIVVHIREGLNPLSLLISIITYAATVNLNCRFLLYSYVWWKAF